MSRAKWKPFFLNKFLIKNISNDIEIKSRNSTIMPKFLNQNIFVHNGNSFIKINITEEKIGKKFGEFSFTRKPFTFKKKIKWGKK